MITKIQETKDGYILTNRVHVDYTVLARSEEDVYNYEAIICHNLEEVEQAISKWGFRPTEALAREAQELSAKYGSDGRDCNGNLTGIGMMAAGLAVGLGL